MNGSKRISKQTILDECILCGFVIVKNVSDPLDYYFKCPKCTCNHRVKTDRIEGNINEPIK